VPRHHLSGQVHPSARPAFNSLEFGDITPGSEVHGKVHDKISETEANKKKKKKNKHSLNEQSSQHTAKSNRTPVTPDIATSSAAVNGQGKKIQDDNSAQVADKAEMSTQKRKRRSTTAHELPSTAGVGQRAGSLRISTQYLEDLKSSMGDMGKSFSQCQSVPKPLERAAKKQKKKTNRKSEGDAATNGTAEATSNDASQAAGHKAGKVKKYKIHSNPVVSSPAKTAVPVPTPRARQASAPRRTPIPLPPESSFERTKSLVPTYQKKNKANRANSEVLVDETHPSQMAHSAEGFEQTPILFALPQMSVTPTINHKKTKKGPAVDAKQMSSVPTNEPSVVNCMRGTKPQSAMSNLLQYKQTLNDEPKPRPHGRSSSIAASIESSDSGLSGKDTFTRVNKPYSRSGAEFDPFVVPPKQNRRKSRKLHDVRDESSLEAFTISFTASQKTVNFTDEQDYLGAYTASCSANAAAGALPCLNKATGCNPKREQLLQLRQPATTPLNVGISQALAAATKGSITAETLLTLAVTARIPIPLGRIDGMWKLYCPAYAATHIDKYGSGQRTLHVAPLAGVTHASTYTARLALPPRSLPFSIHAFDAPPHASFRATRLETVAEGYGFEVVFLGNGYLKAFVDLQELLMGKKMEGKGGNEQKMEFWGVREGALVWEEEVDELEVVGKKLFRAYDGE